MKKRAAKKTVKQKPAEKNSIQKKKQLTKKEIEDKKQLGLVLFITGQPQNLIADYLNVTPKTVSTWATEGKWKEKRSAATVTRPELVNKVLLSIAGVLDKASEAGNQVDADKLIKLAKTIEFLDKKNNPVNAMEWFEKFNKMMLQLMATDKELNADFIKKVNKYQIAFVNSLISNE
jgi:hypothetical protein